VNTAVLEPTRTRPIPSAPNGLEFLAQRVPLLAALALAARAVPGRTVLPILSHVLIEYRRHEDEPASLTLSCTDQELGMIVEVEDAGQVGLPGKAALALPAKLLLEMLGSMDRKIVEFKQGRSYSCEITSGATRFELNGLGDMEFPLSPSRIPQGSTDYSLCASELRARLLSTRFAVSHDDTRPALTGINFDGAAAGLTFAATDTHRLAVSYQAHGDDATTPVAAIIPGRAVDLFLAVLSSRGELASEQPVTLSFDLKTVRLALPGMSVWSRLLEGPFPDYGRVMPKAFSHRLTFQRKALLAALKRVAVIARQAGATPRVTLKPGQDLNTGSVELTAGVNGVGQAQEYVDVSVESSDEQTVFPVVAFNSGFLVEALQAITSDRVTVGLTGELTPAELTGEDEGSDEGYRHILMPMQLS
jgi:DNA polymerase III subunit beta